MNFQYMYTAPHLVKTKHNQYDHKHLIATAKQRGGLWELCSNWSDTWTALCTKIFQSHVKDDWQTNKVLLKLGNGWKMKKKWLQWCERLIMSYRKGGYSSYWIIHQLPSTLCQHQPGGNILTENPCYKLQMWSSKDTFSCSSCRCSLSFYEKLTKAKTEQSHVRVCKWSVDCTPVHRECMINKYELWAFNWHVCQANKQTKCMITPYMHTSIHMLCS